jgi:hypothetical protein
MRRESVSEAGASKVSGGILAVRHQCRPGAVGIQDTGPSKKTAIWLETACGQDQREDSVCRQYCFVRETNLWRTEKCQISGHVADTAYQFAYLLVPHSIPAPRAASIPELCS